MHEFAHVSRMTPRCTIVSWRLAHLILIYPFPVVDWVGSAFLFELYRITG